MLGGSGPTVRIRWSPLPIDGDRSFLFSPRSGRTHLLDAHIADGSIVPSLLGLRAVGRCDELVDPASAVLPVGPSTGNRRVGWALPRVYRFVHRHRVVASACRVVHVSRAINRLRKPQPWTLDDIGQLIGAVEQRAGISDCYPRALLTAHLCLRARRDCSIAFGILAPTPNLHAWCVSDHVVPYEPEPRYWWYRPLAVIDIARRARSRSFE